MNKASPVNLRQGLEAAKVYADVGVDFIPIPVLSEEGREELIKLADLNLSILLRKAEQDENG